MFIFLQRAGPLLNLLGGWAYPKFDFKNLKKIKWTNMVISYEWTPREVSFWKKVDIWPALLYRWLHEKISLKVSCLPASAHVSEKVNKKQREVTLDVCCKIKSCITLLHSNTLFLYLNSTFISLKWKCFLYHLKHWNGRLYPLR